jgi:hypothetical protein
MKKIQEKEEKSKIRKKKVSIKEEITVIKQDEIEEDGSDGSSDSDSD